MFEDAKINFPDKKYIKKAELLADNNGLVHVPELGMKFSVKNYANMLQGADEYELTKLQEEKARLVKKVEEIKEHERLMQTNPKYKKTIEDMEGE